MKTPKSFLVAAAAASLLGLAARPARALEDPKNTLFSVTDPVRVGETTLGAGSYVIRVVNRTTDLNMLQVTDPDSLTVYTTFQARQHPIQPYAVSPVGTLTFDDAPGTAPLLRSWDLPNRAFGYDIVTRSPKTPAVASFVVKGAPYVRSAK